MPVKIDGPTVAVDDLHGMTPRAVAWRYRNPRFPSQIGESVDGRLPLMRANEDVHVLHRPEPGIPVVQERQGRSFQQHRFDPAPVQLAEDHCGVAQPELIAIPRVTIDALELAHERIAHTLPLEVAV